MKRIAALLLALFALGAQAQPIPNSNDVFVPAPDGKIHSCCIDGDVSGDVPLGFSGLAGGMTAAGFNTGIVGTPVSANVCPYLEGDERLTASLSLVDSTGDNPASEGITVLANCTGDDIALLEMTCATTGSGTFQVRATGVGSSDDSSDISWSCIADPGDSGFSFNDVIGAGTNTNSTHAITARATYHNISLYWDETANNTTNQALCRYRQKSTATWYRCPDLWFDDRASGSGDGLIPRGAKQNRGSILHKGTALGVEPDTTYQIELLTESTRKLATAEVTTWDSIFPEEGNPTCGAIVELDATRTTTLTISTSGTPGSWRCYQPNGYTYGGTRAQWDVGTNDYCIRIEANYIVVRGLQCQDADEVSIAIKSNQHHILIEDNVLHDYGYSGGTPVFACNTNGGGVGPLVGTSSSLSSTNVSVQDNYIHTPDSDANTWNESRSTGDGCGPEGDPVHSAGATAIYFKDMGPQVVVRRNRIDAPLTQMHDDLIGGAQNFSFNGGFRSDFDIYWNDLSGGWDDCLETDGSGENGRVYENLMHQCYDMMSTSGVSLGPLYVMRNIAYLSQKGDGPLEQNGNGDPGQAGWFIKVRAQGTNQDKVGPFSIGQGKYWFLHNTVKRDSAALGVDVPMQIVDGEELANTSGYNNVIETNSAPSSAVRGFICTTSVAGTSSPAGTLQPPDWENNIWRTTKPTCDGAGVTTTPTYQAGHSSGIYTPAAGGPQHDHATVIPGVNDRFFDSAPDLGAVERGQTAVTYGPRAP